MTRELKPGDGLAETAELLVEPRLVGKPLVQPRLECREPWVAGKERLRYPRSGSLLLGFEVAAGSDQRVDLGFESRLFVPASGTDRLLAGHPKLGDLGGEFTVLVVTLT